MGDGAYNNTNEKDAANQRVASEIASHLRGSVSTLDALSCTGELPNWRNLTHGYRCGEDEPGERVCVAGPVLGESRIKEVGPRGLGDQGDCTSSDPNWKVCLLSATA